MIGLGKLGANMATQLLNGGHQVVGYDLNEINILALQAKGAEGASTLAEVAEKVTAPHVAWVVVPAGNLLIQLFGLRDIVDLWVTIVRLFQNRMRCCKTAYIAGKSYVEDSLHYYSGISGKVSFDKPIFNAKTQEQGFFC